MKQIHPAGSEPQNAVDKAAYDFALLWFNLAKRWGEIESDTTVVRVSRAPSFPVRDIYLDLSDGSHNKIEIRHISELENFTSNDG
jgi:hypothetical protein